MRSNMPPQKDFSLVPSIGGKPRSLFNRSHTHKTTFDAGLCIPVLTDEVLPGDSIDLRMHAFARFSSPLKTPIMDNVNLDAHFFFIPTRLLWDNWEKFNGAQDDPGDSISFTIPRLTGTILSDHDELSSYLGIPKQADNTSNGGISCLFHRAYNKVWNEWYRSEDLQNSAAENTGDGPDNQTDYALYSRGKRHDYFTSCLPYPQKGATGVTIGLSGTAPVYGDGKALGLEGLDVSATEKVGLVRTDGSNASAMLHMDTDAYNVNIGTSATSSTAIDQDRAIGVTQTSGESGMVANLASATGIDINDLRTAIATQQFLEIDARGGTRYVELLKAHFGVISPDFRLQRPEYLGGGTASININPVTQTSASDSGNSLYQGHQAAHGTMTGSMGFSKSFVEHGILLGIVSVRADLNYQNGIHKMFTRGTRYDFYHPVFANLGEQAVLKQEIFYDSAGETNSDVFGYQERWAEYRYAKNRITGKFNSDVTGSLDSWHLAEDLTSSVALNASFIQESPPMSRIMQITTEPEILADFFFEMKQARCMPAYSVPGLSRL